MNLLIVEHRPHLSRPPQGKEPSDWLAHYAHQKFSYPHQGELPDLMIFASSSPRLTRLAWHSDRHELTRRDGEYRMRLTFAGDDHLVAIVGTQPLGQCNISRLSDRQRRAGASILLPAELTGLKLDVRIFLPLGDCNVDDLIRQTGGEPTGSTAAAVERAGSSMRMRPVDPRWRPSQIPITSLYNRLSGLREVLVLLSPSVAAAIPDPSRSAGDVTR